VHTLKSSAGQIGETKLQKAAADAENMLQNNENKITENQIKKLEDNLTSVLDKLKAVSEDMPKEIQMLYDFDKISGILDELEPLLKGKNTKSFSYLDKVISIPGAGELAAQIEKYNFKSALTSLAKLRKDLGI